MANRLNELEASSLGKTTNYSIVYDKTLLFPISRENGRAKLKKSIGGFTGVDIWHSYEFTWLNLQGKPMVAILQWIIPCDSPNLIESKSCKLYLNSFSQTKFSSAQNVLQQLTEDFSEAAGKTVAVKMFLPHEFSNVQIHESEGVCLDELELVIEDYEVNSNLLLCENIIVEEKLNTNLFRSNCPVTDQPDFASVYIHYRGKKIIQESLLKYLISYRLHQDFHEACAERIYADLMNYCHCEDLTVYLRFTRRGGLDINPIRTNQADYVFDFHRLVRQ